jgi:hypothetical protein
MDEVVEVKLFTTPVEAVKLVTPRLETVAVVDAKVFTTPLCTARSAMVDVVETMFDKVADEAVRLVMVDDPAVMLDTPRAPMEAVVDDREDSVAVVDVKLFTTPEFTVRLEMDAVVETSEETTPDDAVILDTPRDVMDEVVEDSV